MQHSAEPKAIVDSAKARPPNSNDFTEEAFFNHE
jgi:hypothetical protein